MARFDAQLDNATKHVREMERNFPNFSKMSEQSNAKLEL